MDLLKILVQVQIEPCVGGRQDPAEGQEGRPRHHPRLHPIAAAAEAGECATRKMNSKAVEAV